jgi:hypothetical protein
MNVAMIVVGSERRFGPVIGGQYEREASSTVRHSIPGTSFPWPQCSKCHLFVKGKLPKAGICFQFSSQLNEVQVCKCFGHVLFLTSKKIDKEMLVAGKKVRLEKVGGFAIAGLDPWRVFHFTHVTSSQLVKCAEGLSPTIKYKLGFSLFS